MAKKIFWVTLIASIICGIATIALVPLAIGDVAGAVSEYNKTAQIDKSTVALQEKTGINKIQIIGYYDKVILEESKDGSMAVTKDQIASQLSGPFADRNDEMIYIKDDVYSIRYANNDISIPNREDTMKYLASAFSNEQRILIVHVPAGMEVYLNRDPWILENNGNVAVFIDNSSSYSHNNRIEYKSIDPSISASTSNDALESSSSEAPSSTVNAPSTAPTTPVPSNINLEQVKTDLKTIMNKNNDVYIGFMKGTVSEDDLRNTLIDSVDTQLETLKGASVEVNTYLSNADNYDVAARCAELFIEENILEIKSELLEGRYDRKEITKADYYAQDLELDQAEDAIKMSMMSAELALAGRTMQDWERVYVFRIPFLYDVD